MYRIYVSVRLLLLFVSSAYAQWDVRSIALSNSQLQLPGDIHCGPMNPAVLPWTKSLSVALTAMPAPFDLPMLRRFGIAVGLPLFKSGALFSITGMGGDLVRRLEMRTSLGIRLSESFGSGVSIIGEQWAFEHVGARSTLGMEIGTMFNTDHVSLGVNSALRPFDARGDVLEVMTASAAVRPSDQTQIMAEAEQARLHSLALRFGVMHRPVESVIVYAGWSEEPDLLSGGVSVVLIGVETTYGSQWHSELGWIHAFGISWHFSK